MAANSDLESRVARILRALHLPYEREVSAGGLKVDFVVDVAPNRSLVLEVKHALGDPAWFESQAKFIERNVGRPVLMVVPGAPDRRSPRRRGRLVFERELKNRLHQIGEVEPSQFAERSVTFAERPVIFAAMPYEPQFDDIFDVFVRAADEVGGAIKRVDKSVFNGSTVEAIKRAIRGCRFLVADLTDHNPNVLFEIGFAKARPKNTVHVCASPRRELPFDVRDDYAIKYKVGRTTKVFPEVLAHFHKAME